MKHYAGLDVSVKETSVCIVDETGKVCREVKVPSHPEDVVRVLKDPTWQVERVGLEAGPLSQWLFSGVAEAGLPVVCIETRHTKAFLKAQVNKSDRNDARGIAQMMRVNLFRPVHVKTLTSQKRRALLTARKLLQEKALAIENDIRGLLRNFGLKVGVVGIINFEDFRTCRGHARACRDHGGSPRCSPEAPRAGRKTASEAIVDRPGRRGVPATDDDPGRRSGGVFGLHCHHRPSGPVQKF